MVLPRRLWALDERSADPEEPELKSLAWGSTLKFGNPCGEGRVPCMERFYLSRLE